MPSTMTFTRRKTSQPTGVPTAEELTAIDELLSAREFERRAFATPHLSRSRRSSHELDKIISPGWTSKEARAYYSTDRSMWAGEANRYDNIWAYDRTALRVPVYPRDWERSKAHEEGVIQRLVKEGKRKDDESGYMGYLNANFCRDKKGSWWVISQAPLPEGIHPFLLSILLKIPSIELQRSHHGTAHSHLLRTTVSRQSSEGSLRSLSLSSPSSGSASSSGFNFSMASLSLKRKKSSDTQTKRKRPERHAIIVQLADCVENGLIKADPYLPDTYVDPVVYPPPDILKDLHPSVSLKLQLQQEKPTLASTYTVCTLTCTPIPTPPPPSRPSSMQNPRLSSRFNSFSSDGASETASIASGKSVDDRSSPVTVSSASLRTLQSLQADMEPIVIPEQPEPMTIHHLSYHAWPDHGVPRGADVAALRRLMEEVGRMQRTFGCEVWVHCSAGVGRSGTFVALSSLLLPPQHHPNLPPLQPMMPSPLVPLPKHLAEDKVVATIDMLRDQRSWMCERKEQIELIYDVCAGRDGR